MFRRFMIVCWVLFTISTVASLIGYVGYRVNEEPTPTVRPDEKFVPLEEMTLEETRAQLLAVARSRGDSEKRGDRRERFLIAAWLGSIGAGIILLWNIIWHTAHWVWMGRKEISSNVR